MPATPTLGGVLAAVITAQTSDLVDLERGVREDAPDAVHRYRVTLRRLRSVLAAFDSDLDPVAAAAALDLPVLTARLRDTARAFGLARDAEVNGELVAERLADDADAAGPGAVEAGQILAETAAADYQEHRVAAIALLDGYGPGSLTAVLTALASAAGEAPQTHAATGSGARDDVDDAFGRTIDAQAAHVLRLARKAKRAAPADAATALHEVRKKAKRLRYTIEELTARGVEVPPGRQDVVDAAHRIQKHLGTHHDSVGLAAFVRATVEARPATGRRALSTPVAFAAGELAGSERAVQAEALRKYRRARRALRDALA